MSPVRPRRLRTPRATAALALIASALAARATAAQTAPPVATATATAIAGMSTSLGDDAFTSTVVTSGPDPARVTCALATACPSAHPVVALPAVAATRTQPGRYACTVRLPPGVRAVGAFAMTVRAEGPDGRVLASQTADLRRPVTAQVQITPSVPAVDVAHGPGAVELRLDVTGTGAVRAMGLVTNLRVNPVVGFATAPGEIEMDARQAGATSAPVQGSVRAESPTRYLARFEVPAGIEPTHLEVRRVYLEDAECRSGMVSVYTPPTVAITNSGAIAPLVRELRFDLAQVPRPAVTVQFEALGLPTTRRVRGLSVADLAVELIDGAGHTLARLRAEPYVGVMQESPWHGAYQAGPVAIGTGRGEIARAAVQAGITARVVPRGRAPLLTTSWRARLP